MTNEHRRRETDKLGPYVQQVALDKANERIAELEGNQKWRPIENAPKDGTIIWISGGKYGCELSPGEFHNKENVDLILVYWNETFECFMNKDFYYIPKYWSMPLPPPPTVNQDE